VNETSVSPTEQALERYAHFLQRTKEMGVVGHRGGLKATHDLLQMCDLQAGQRILEVGCGSGYTACTAAKQLQPFIVAGALESHRVLKPGGFLANNEVTFLKPPPDDFLAAIRGAAPKVPGALAVPVHPQEHRHLLEELGFVSVDVATGDVSLRQQTLEQVQIDGFRALKPFFFSIFDREVRNSVYRREMGEAQRTFEEHTGYGLYFARKPAEGSTKP
jgi:hypothetical protein